MFCTISCILASKITPPLIPSQSTAVFIGKFVTAQPERGVMSRDGSPVIKQQKQRAGQCKGISLLNEDMKKSSRFYSTLTHHLHSQSM